MLLRRYFIPYRLCQDSLEHFFGDIRLRGGWCSNPTALQFRYAYRAIVSKRLQLFGLSTAGRNCAEEPLEMDDGYVPQIDNEVDLDRESDVCDQLLQVLQRKWPSEIRGNVMYYMAGWAARQVAKRIKCTDCKEALFTAQSFNNALARLVTLRQQGALVHPSRSVYRVIHLTDQALKLERAKPYLPSDSRFLQHLSIHVYRAASSDRLLFPELDGHDATVIDQHVPRLIKALAEKYATALLGHIVKEETTARMGAAANRRNRMSRITIFKAL